MSSINAHKDGSASVVSYPFVVGRYTMTTDQLRIVLTIVKFLQNVFRGKDLQAMMKWQKNAAGLPDKERKAAMNEFLDYVRENLAKTDIPGVSLELSSGGFLYVRAPYAAFAARGAKHYDRLKDAFRNLANARVEIENGNIWTTFAVVESPVIERYAGIEFSMGRYMLLQLLNIAGGFRLANIEVAFRLKSMYSIRMLMLLSGQKQPVVMSVDRLREIFGATDKYKRDSDFIERVIAMAKKELDEEGTQPFDYELIYDRKNTRKVSNVRFTLSQR